MLVTDRLYFVLASISDDPFDYITGKQAMDSVDRNGITNSETVLGIGMSWIRFMEVVGAVGSVLAIIICAYKLVLFKRDPRMYAEVKKEMMQKCLITVVIFAFIAIAEVIFYIVRSLAV